MSIVHKRERPPSVTASPFSPLFSPPSWIAVTRDWVEHGTTHTPESRGELLHLIARYLQVISLRDQALQKLIHSIDQQLTSLENHYHGPAVPTKAPLFSPLFSPKTWSENTRYWLEHGDTHARMTSNKNILNIMAHYIKMIGMNEALIDIRLDRNEKRLRHLRTLMPHHMVAMTDAALQQLRIPLREITQHNDATASPLRPLFSPEIWSRDTALLLQHGNTHTREGRADLLEVLLEPYLRVIGRRETHFDDITTNHETLIHILIQNHQSPHPQEGVEPLHHPAEEEGDPHHHDDGWWPTPPIHIPHHHYYDNGTGQVFHV
jgi:hypothetical protein